MRNPIIAGDRLYLTPEVPEDSHRMAEFEARDIDQGLFISGREPRSPILFKQSLETEDPGTPDEVILAVRRREDDELLGIVELTQIDWVNRTAETGSYLGLAEWRGRGYGTEAKHLLLEYAFERLHLHLIWSTVFEANERSAAALRKQGYREAGRLRYRGIYQGVYRDSLLFDLKREEWLEAREHWRESALTPDPSPTK